MGSAPAGAEWGLFQHHPTFPRPAQAKVAWQHLRLLRCGLPVVYFLAFCLAGPSRGLLETVPPHFASHATSPAQVTVRWSTSARAACPTGAHAWLSGEIEPVSPRFHRRRLMWLLHFSTREDLSHLQAAAAPAAVVGGRRCDSVGVLARTATQQRPADRAPPGPHAGKTCGRPFPFPCGPRGSPCSSA